MNQKALFDTFCTVRQNMLAKYSDIDPTPLESQDKFWKNEQALERYTRITWFGNDVSFGTAVLQIVQTPRILKHILRHIDSIWEKLHGEISYDDLVISTIIRYGANEAFDFLLRRIDSFQMTKRDINSDSENVASKRQQDIIQAEWEKIIKGPIEWNAEAARFLIILLFPNAAKLFGDERYDDTRKSPQGVQYWEPTNYWSRMLAGEIESTDVSDQLVLRTMREWAESSSETALVNGLLSTTRFVQIWEYFADWVKVPNFLFLTGHVLDAIRLRDGQKASADGQNDALIALWRQAKKNVEKNDDAKKWLINQINHSVKNSLRLANDLYYYWASIRYGVIKSGQDRNIVRESYVENIKQHINGKSDALIEILDSDYPYSIYQLIHPADDDETPSILAQPSDWQWLSSILIESAKKTPPIVIPQIASLVMDFKHNTSYEYHAQFNQQMLDGMFGQSISELMKLLTTEFEMPPVPTDTSANIKMQKTRELASQWLKENQI